jgi:hypothetical protein
MPKPPVKSDLTEREDASDGLDDVRSDDAGGDGPTDNEAASGTHVAR